MQIIDNIDQGTDEWLALRSGVLTASRFKDVMAKGQGKTRMSYMHQLAAERLTGIVEPSFSNASMEWGTETEPQARAMYELESGNTVDEVAFIQLNNDIGVSPDGLVGDNGLLEIKCPKTTTHIQTVLSAKVPTCHKAQIQGQLWVSEREWLDFVSFDPRINSDKSFFCVRVERDETYIKELETACNIFIDELNEIIKKLGN